MSPPPRFTLREGHIGHTIALAPARDRGHNSSFRVGPGGEVDVGRERFRREMSPNERLYRVGERFSPPFAMQVFVEGRGEVDVARLRRAVAVAADACPGSRLVADGTSWVDSGTPPPVRVLPRGTFDGYDFDRAPFLRSGMDSSRGPTCEVVVLEGAPPAIVFRAFHGVMDGRGMFLWMKDVFRALRDEPLEGADSTLTDVGFLATRDDVVRRPAMGLSYLSPLGGEASPEYLWKRLTLRGSHPALVAKLATLVREHAGHERARFMIPVDMRRHAPELRSTANLTLPILLDVARGEGWEDVQAKLLDALAEGRELALDGTEGLMRSLPMPALVAAIRGLLAAQRATGRYLGSGILSHVGRVELDDFRASGFVPRTVYSLPVHAPIVPFSFVAVDVGDRVELTLTCAAGPGMEARADALLAAIERKLGAPEPVRAPRFECEATLVDLFLERASETPDAVALVEGDRTLTYRELERRARAIAGELASRGIGPGSLVGLVVERTIDAMEALFGVLFAGAAYVPIDPRYPDERIAFMLEDARAATCIVHREHEARVRAAHAGELLVLESLTGDPDAPVVRPRADDLAYVIYTSGSTGRPKGVQIEHGSLAAYVAWAKPLYRVDARARFALFTSLSFDLSLTSFVLPLVAGGSVALFPGELDPAMLRSVVEASGSNMLKLTPTHLELIARLEHAPAGYKTLVVGGEQLRGPAAARAQAMFGPDCRIVNEYGPTEATIGCIVHVFDPATESESPAVPIGRAVPYTEVHLLDAHRRPVAPFAVGELYLGGAQLARGYLRRPELDDERFVELSDGTRAYRTGDLARVLPSGALEYLGRTDDQIKIRGHRIEPGEIEAVLEEHPAVLRAVVLGRVPPGRSEKVLVAYVVADADFDVETGRAYVASRMPSPCVPSAFVRVPDVPLTVNGKIDARALPDPFAGLAEDGVPTPRRDPIEEAILAVWSEVLRRDLGSVDADADFHLLGGDSLTMIEMLALVAKRVVGPARADAFLASTRPLVKSPTLSNVRRAVENARAPIEARA